jgi:peptidoglycan hydrolase-like protein with peptidoglycan-binding domain
MFLLSKIGHAGMTVTLLTTGMLQQGFPRSGAGAESSKAAVSTFVTKNEIEKMQEALRNKGYYRAKIDGVFGLQTRASIRAYQKAHNLPITGRVDAPTADGLGVRPESTWDNSENAGQRIGRGSDRTDGELKRDKPSAGIRRPERGVSMTGCKKPSRAIAVEDNNRGDGAKEQRTVSEKQNQ